MKVILASQSKYRRALLEERGVPIKAVSPTADEEQLKTELLQENYPLKSIGLKLAEAKAESILKVEPEAIVIGCDQLCVFENQILNKPGTIEKNIEHLKLMNGKIHHLFTCVCIVSKDFKILFSDTVELKMKKLSDKEITDYVNKDQPLDCAGGYKYEVNGHKLFESVRTEDVTSIQGLPLKQTLDFLKKDFKIKF